MAPSYSKTLRKNNPAVSRGLYGILAGAMLVPVICFNSADTVKGLSMALMVVSMVVVLLRFKQVCQQMNFPLLMLVLITAMGGVSTAYAVSGKFALQGTLYLMTALCISQ